MCEYSSKRKSCVVKHINRKNSCGVGTKEVIEIPIDIKCEYCDKKFTTNQHLMRHQKDNCLKKIQILEKKLNDANDKIKELEKNQKIINNTTNNNTINNYNTVNIIVNNYENTSLEKLTDKIYNSLINNAEEPYNIIPKLIEEVHFNPDIPENHNVYISNINRNNKHIKVFRNGQWEIQNKDTEIDNLINDKDNIISDWIEEKGDKYPKASQKYSDYLNQKYDSDIAKLVKEEVELLLYNKRHMVKDN